MPLLKLISRALCGAALGVSAAATLAAEFPTPVEGAFIARDFRFHTGEVMPEVRLNYRTIGAPTGVPVLLLHGTAQSSAVMVLPTFGGELFGPGQPLDASKYFIILPDALGTGKSSKPSDGLRAKFPRYNYDDMVLAQYRLVTEGLGLRHLRLVLGNSMGGMQTWIWGVNYPGFMDALVPMASQPTEMSGRNWMMRRMVVDAVRTDPDWKGGDYTVQPPRLKVMNAYFGIASSGGTHAYHQAAPTREAADKLLDARLNAPFPADANDYLYQWDSSRDYNPAPGLERIKAALLVINAADDERNPPELGIMERELGRIKGSQLLLIPASNATRGHGTTALATFWAARLEAFMKTVPAVPAR